MPRCEQKGPRGSSIKDCGLKVDLWYDQHCDAGVTSVVPITVCDRTREILWLRLGGHPMLLEGHPPISRDCEEQQPHSTGNQNPGEDTPSVGVGWVFGTPGYEPPGPAAKTFVDCRFHQKDLIPED